MVVDVCLPINTTHNYILASDYHTFLLANRVTFGTRNGNGASTLLIDVTSIVLFECEMPQLKRKSSRTFLDWYGASLGGSLCNTSKMYVRKVRLASHESKTTQ